MADRKGALFPPRGREPSALAGRIEHAILSPEAGVDEVDLACAAAYELGFGSVCVHPVHVERARRWMKRTGTRLCAAIDFPFGTSSSLTKLFAAQEAAAKGAAEVAVVIAPGALSGDDWPTVIREVGAIARSVGPRVRVRAIVEARAVSADTFKRAVAEVKAAGATGLQTSTGWADRTSRAGDLAAVRAVAGAEMALVAAGGITSWAEARDVLQAGAEQLSTPGGARVLEEWEEAGRPPLAGGGV